MAKAPQIEMLPIGKVRPADDNIRSETGDVSELAESIKSAGLLEPLLAADAGNGYMVVAGNRRLAAAKKAGLKEVPAIVRAYSDQERVEVMLIENLQRLDLDPLEEARAYQRLLILTSMTQKELAKKIAVAQSHVSKRLALLELPESVQKRVDSGGITIGAAVELAKLAPKDAKAVEKIASKETWDQRPLDEQSVRYSVQDAIKTLEVSDAIAQRIAQLTKKGLKAVRMTKSGLAPRGYIELGQHDSGYYEVQDKLPVDSKKHAKEPCHAVGVSNDHYGGMKETALCSERKRHKIKTLKERRAAKQTREERQAEKEVEETAKVAEQRRQFLPRLIENPLSKDELLKLYVAGKVSRMTDAASQVAGELLGLTPAKTENWQGVEVDDWSTPLFDEVPKDPARVGTAAILGDNEAELVTRAGWSGNPYPAKRGYLELLEGHGYGLSEREKELLGGSEGLE